VEAQDFEKAAQLRDIEKNYRQQIDAQREKRRAGGAAHRPVGPEDIAAVVAEWTGIPVTRLTSDESQRLLHLEETLHSAWWGRTRPSGRGPGHPPRAGWV
jgi:ATP-dependent Clp protease ATP-binding subunit ClpC